MRELRPPRRPPGSDAGPSARSGPFARLLLPGIILQSVLIGGGYATGREIVEYGAKFGARGWVAVAVIFTGFTLMATLTFEVARVFGAYDYKRFIRVLIGPAWPLFDVLFAAMAVLIIAVIASAAASILDETLGLPPWAGTVGIVLAVAALLYAGGAVIEAFKTVGTVLLYGGYAAFGALVLAKRWDEVRRTFAAGDVSYLGDVSIAAVLGAGALYVGYNLAVFPTVLFSLHRQTTRRDTVVAGLLSGLLMTLPFALTYVCVMGFYPAREVVDAPVPWLRMLAGVGGPWVIAVFGVVIGWTLLETCVGLLHALVDRIHRNLGGSGSERGLTRLQSGLIGAGMLIGAGLLSRVGIIALVSRGYTLMGYFFIALFAVPLLTVGVGRIRRATRSDRVRVSR